MAKKTVLQAAKQALFIWNFKGDLDNTISFPQSMIELEEAIDAFDQKINEPVEEEFTNMATGKKVIINKQ